MKKLMNNNHSLHLIKYASGTRHCSGCFTRVNPFNLYSNPAEGSQYVHLTDEDTEAECVNNLSEVTQPVSGGFEPRQ